MAVIDVGDRAMAIDVAAAATAARMAAVCGLAEAIRSAAFAGVTDVVPSPGRVTVVYDPLVIAGHATLRAELAALATTAAPATAVAPARRHEIPVCYGGDLGPDLDDVCRFHMLDRHRFVALHTGADYLVESIGFLPGFGYLTGLPPALATPRRATPRRLVPAGSVGIGGDQTAAYPCESPGGWNLVGATTAPLFDPTRPQPALLAVGDAVRFVAIDRLDLRHRHPADVAAPAAVRDAAVTVLAAGLFTTIQDLGRPGHRAAGVPLSGAVEPAALRAANRLVGNAADAAALEVTLLGPTLRFERDAVIALAGATFPGMPAGVAQPVSAGATLTLGHATSGCRGYLAIAGGIDVPVVLGSRSTLVAARLGGLRGLPLAAGDRLPVGTATGRPAAGAPPPRAGRAATDRVMLRMIPGEQFDRCGTAIWAATHTASSRSDRMGVRLEGDGLGGGEGAGASRPVAVIPGTVQLPPDGRPIVLLADAQTTGGYPVLGTVIAADLPLVAQLRPGDAVGWRPATLAEAHDALRAADHASRGGA